MGQYPQAACDGTVGVVRALSMLLARVIVTCTAPVTAPSPSPSQSARALPSVAASPRPSLPAGGPEITEVVVARVEHQPRLPGVEAVDFLDEQTGWLGG